MSRTGFATGLVTGAVVGAAIGMIIDPVKDKHYKQLRRQSNGLFRTVGHVLDNMMDMRR